MPPSRSSGLRRPGIFGEGRPTLLRVAVSIAVGAFLLVADVVTGFKGLAGVLYVPLLVAVATEAPMRHIWGYGVLGGSLAVLAYLMAYGHSPHATTPGPIIIGLTTAAITSAIVSRLVASREALQAANRNLAISEFRFRALFEQRRFPLWEQDFRPVFAEFARLKAQGVTSLEDHLAAHPDFLSRMSDSVVPLSCNDAMVALVGGKTKADVLVPLSHLKADNATLLPLLQSLYDGEEGLDGPARFVALDGRLKEVWVTGRICRKGERSGIATNFVLDLTERVKAERARRLAQAELARASRAAAIGAISSTIAHDLNQPLAAALSDAQACVAHLGAPTPDVEAAIAAAERAAQAGNRAGEVVQRTRAQVASGAVREEQVDIKALAVEALTLLDADLRAAAVHVSLTAPPAEMSLTADRVTLLQVLVNLVGNAVQAMSAADPSKRRLTIDLAHDLDAILIRISDTGPGIDAAHLERVFEPFFTTRSGAMGIGLAISRAAVEAHGGVLRASSSADGGALLECRIPSERAA